MKISKYEEAGLIARTPGPGRLSKITVEIKILVKAKMQKDYETTAMQLHALLVSRDYLISKKTILHCSTALGWTFCRSAYYQLIWERNKTKCLEWTRQHLQNNFDNFVWTDKCSVQLERIRDIAAGSKESRLNQNQGKQLMHIKQYKEINI